jgi:hypothetical protein
MDTIDELALKPILDVCEEVRRSRRLGGVTAEDFCCVDFGDVAVVVFAPYILLEIVDIDPVMT